jgi:hypothetical protein
LKSNATTSRRFLSLISAAAVSLLVLYAGRSTAAPRTAPSNVSPPTIDGNAQEGQTLTANAGTWRGTQPISYSARWLRCDVGGGNCAFVSSPKQSTYRLGADDVGHTIRVAVTASNADGQATARSRPTATVRPAPVNAPTNISAPTISGTAAEGQTLSGTAGEWQGTKPLDLNFQWQRCDKNGLTCSNIAGETGKTHLLSKADVDNTVRLRIVAVNSAGRTAAFSRPTAVVKGKAPPPPPPPPAPKGPPGAIKLPSGETSIPVTSVDPPQRLVIAQLRFTPNPLRSRAQPITAKFRIKDTRGYVVRGALVFTIPLPYGWTTQPPEVASARDGWASVTMRATTKLPRRGAIVMFARARKPGDFVLTGVSTRRLVQMLVSL